MTITETAVTATLEHVAPDALTIEDNVREAVDLPKEFVASIKQHGVLVPVRAVRLADGTLAVRDGQRRVLAARDAGVDVVPAYVVDVGDERARVLQQLVTNDQRDALTEHDRVQGYATLALAGMSAAAIAKATGAKKARVDQAITVAANDGALTALADPHMTLDAALALVEFEGDDVATKRILDVAASGSDVDFTVKRLREEREQQARRAATLAPFIEAGVRVIEGEATYARNASRLDSLTDATEPDKDGAYPPIDPDAHTSCDGHAVVVYSYGRDEPQVVPYCTSASLHRSRYSGGVAGSGAAKGPLSDEEKAERKELVQRNKEWGVAEPVRREWLAEFLQRKAMPKDALPFAAMVLASQVLHVDTYRAQTLVRSLTPEAVGAKPTHTLVALAIAIVEGPTSRDTWRSPREHEVAYFKQLEAWGYPLADVERLVAESGS